MIPKTIHLKGINLNILLFCLILNGFGAFSQGSSDGDFNYINFLLKKKLPGDALFFLNDIQPASLRETSLDSLNYYYGLSYHFLKKPDSASFFFRKVNKPSPVYGRAAFFSSLNNVYANNYGEAAKDLLVADSLIPREYDQQKKLQLCGIALLQSDFKRADSLIGLFDYADYLYSEEQKTLAEIRKRYEKQKKKSPFVAGLLSAAVPGAGKYYAGRRGQALASFFSCIGTGAMAAESWYRSGLKSPQFIITGSLFSVFYLGNIAGSIYSVKLVKKRNKILSDNAVKSALHKPLRRFFD